MKKLFSVILIFLLCFSLFSCNNNDQTTDQAASDNTTEGQTSTEQPTERPTEKPKATQDPEKPYYAHAVSEKTIDGFSAYLDELKILPGRTQEEFAEQFATYSYKGEALIGEYSDLSRGKLYQIYVGDNSIQPKFMDFTFSHVVGDKEEDLELYIGFPIENLDLPFGITFDDTMTTALVKLDITRIPPFSNFIPDADNSTKMTLYKDDTRSLAYMSHSMCSPVNEGLLYTESYTYTNEQGVEVAVTRSIELYFYIGFFNEAEYITDLAVVTINMSQTTK